jgi:DNA-binding response OmpR family regulator
MAAIACQIGSCESAASTGPYTLFLKFHRYFTLTIPSYSFYDCTPMKVLLIEDNQTIARQIAEFISGHKWQIDYAHNARLGVRLATEQIYDVILLDLNLPDRDGLVVCAEIKQLADVNPPILMLTARDSFRDKAAGFNHGADDYLTKPFDLRELVLRCQALARRQSLHQPKILSVGELELDTNTQVAKRKTVILDLTNIGFRILEILVKSYPKAVSRTFISHQLWGDHPPNSDALKSHIYVLRKVLDKPFDKPLLKTVMNMGFKLELPDESDSEY